MPHRNESVVFPGRGYLDILEAISGVREMYLVHLSLRNKNYLTMYRETPVRGFWQRQELLGAHVVLTIVCAPP